MALPIPKCLPFGVQKVPHVTVANDTFALKTYIMKPYLQQHSTEGKTVYNNLHSRAGWIVVNLLNFGIEANRWRVFQTVLMLPPHTTKSFVLAALVLHNYLRRSSSTNTYCPAGLVDTEGEGGVVVAGNWHQDSTTDCFFVSDIVLAFCCLSHLLSSFIIS